MPLNSCNEAQLRAVKHFTGPMLLLAGPGSGKTFTIIERIRYLIEERGIEPSQILVITFTKAAAAEMEQRFLQAVEGKSSIVSFGTFHAVYFHILRQTYQYTSQNIISEKEKKEYLKQVLNEVRKKGAQIESELTEHLLGEFGRVKNSIGGIKNYSYESGLIEPEEFGKIYRRYREICMKERKMDFDDMALQCLELFRKRPDILKKWQKKYSFIMIDEFQDINLAQYEVIRLLSGEGQNLTVVGDDDQSIYGFRGADPSIMKKFLDDFPKAQTVMLDKNYRSAKSIVRFSMQVIKENNNRFPKMIQAAAKKNGNISIKKFRNKEEEYEILLQMLKNLQKTGHLSECAVICRTNKEVMEIKTRLKKAGVPLCQKTSEISIFEHFIMKDIKDYINFSEGNKSREIFFRIMNKPQRYFLRDSVTEKVDFESMKQYYQGNQEMISKITEFEEKIKNLKDMSPFLAVNYIRKALGYDDHILEMEKKDNAVNLREMIDKIQQDAALYRSTREWLLSVEERKKQSEKTNTLEKSGVTVITMHGAKGLEYRIVILPSINEGNVPYGKMLSKDAVEEERRIFYVAVTRAKEELDIFYVENENREKPSRFLHQSYN